MWDLGGSLWTEGKNGTPMASYLTVMHEIHVLLVEHESEALINTAKMLEICQYRVTLVELASAAITMLASGKVKFDVVLANINSPDLHGFKLLQQAVNMEIPVVLMSSDDNSLVAMRAIESGAFLYVKKPATLEMLRCLWQHVLKEKTRVMRERERLVAADYNARGIEFREVMPPAGDNVGGGNMLTTKDKGKSKKKVRGRRADDEGYDSESQGMCSNKVKRKVCTEWTQELHEKFLDAVEQLGEGRCFPKEILELMNVPGLTRMQVASHLQKCRNDNWRSPEERKSSNLNSQTTSSDTDGSQHKPRRFGSMPRLGKAPSYNGQGQETSGGPGGQFSKAQSETAAPNDGGVHENVASGPISINPHHQHYGTLVHHASHVAPGASSSNPRHPSADEYFNFPEMDCLMQNFSHGLPQGSAGMINNPSHHFEPAAYHEQNSAVPSVETRSQWSSGTSNFGSDDTETKGR